MDNRLRWLAVPLLLLVHSINAQNTYTLSGLVRDSVTKQAVVGAAVIIDYEKLKTGTYTDAEGHYSIKLPAGRHAIVVRNVGYISFRQSLNLYRDRTLNIALSSVVSQLEEVIVTSKGFNRNVQQPLLGVSQVNITTLKRMPTALGEVDILRSLQLLPGVTSVGEAANGVNIRGGTTDQNLILVDDTPIFNPTHMFGLFSVFAPDAVNSLDLYKGNVPARFGGRAASVLDISLKNPSLDQLKLNGGISLVANRLTLDMPLVKGKLGLILSGRGAFNDFLLRQVSPRLSGIQATFGDGSAKAFWRVDNRNTITAMVYYNSDLFQTNLLGSLASINAVGTQYKQRTTNGMLRWFHTFTPRLNLQTTALIARYEPTILSIEDSTNNKVALVQRLLQRQIKSSLNYQTDHQKLEGGFSAVHYHLNPGALQPNGSPNVNARQTPLENALELALHLEDEISLSDKLSVSAGIRYAHFLNLGPSTVRLYNTTAEGGTEEFNVIDSVRYRAGQVSQQYGGLEPRVGLRYAIGNNASIKLGYNQMRQYLQIVTNTTTPLPTARWKTADTHIRPQVSQLWAIGWFQNSSSNILEYSVEGYWRTTQNVLDYKPGADFMLQPYPETQLLSGRSRAYGLEIMASKKKGELTGWVNYTYARTLNQIDQGPDFRQRINGGSWYAANYDRPHSVNLSLNINQGKHHSFSFNVVYSTGRPYTAPEGFIRYQNRNYPYYNRRNQNRLPDYHRLDFSWNIYNPTVKQKRWRGHWNFTIYNLYGRKNVYSIFFRTEGQATNPYRLSIFAAPIPSLAYNFEFL